jgi:hypothetical protein
MRTLPGPPARSAALLRRWDRIGLGVRLAYNPWHPPVIRCYLRVGDEVARAGAASALAVQRHMLGLLLRTADDRALPWIWRATCHEHVVFPQARLATLARRGAEVDTGALEHWIEAVGRRLAEPVTGGDPAAPGQD